MTQLKSTCGPCAMFSRFTIKCVKHMLETGLITSLFAIFGAKSGRYYSKKCGNLIVLKRKDSNCIGILSDQGRAATASNLSKYTISEYHRLFFTLQGHSSSIIYSQVT